MEVEVEVGRAHGGGCGYARGGEEAEGSGEEPRGLEA